jgi:uncharacterized protein YxjI
MREKLLSIGDDFWIEGEEGNRAYRVDGKAARLRETILLKDAEGREVAKIQERKLSIRDKMAIERDGETIATVHKALVGIRDRFMIDLGHGADLKAHGNIVDHEYEIERGLLDDEIPLAKPMPEPGFEPGCPRAGDFKSPASTVSPLRRRITCRGQRRISARMLRCPGCDPPRRGEPTRSPAPTPREGWASAAGCPRDGCGACSRRGRGSCDGRP